MVAFLSCPFYYGLQKGTPLQLPFCRILTHDCRFSRANIGLLLIEEDLPGPHSSCLSVSLVFCPWMVAHTASYPHTPTVFLFPARTTHPLPISPQWSSRLFKTIFPLKRVLCSPRKSSGEDTGGALIMAGLWTWEVPVCFGPCRHLLLTHFAPGFVMFSKPQRLVLHQNLKPGASFS